MPIIGMTDAGTSVPRFPLLGVLRKGAARPEKGDRPGKDLEWFRFDPRKPEIGQAFTKAYGEQPDSLTVFLPYALISDVFPTWREEWVGGGLVHRCDGKTCSIWRNAQGRYSRESKPCPCIQDAENERRCKPIGRLSLILPDLLQAGFVGYVSLNTTSINDVISIHAALLAVAEARGNEDLRGIAFQLYRQTESISTPGSDGKRMRRDVSLVKLVPSVEWVRSQLAASAQDALLSLPDVNTATGDAMDAPDENEPIEAEANSVESAWDEGTTPLATGDPAVEANKKAEKWVSAFVSKACTHYAPAGTDPDLLEPRVYEALGATRAEMVQAYIERKLDINVMKAKLDEQLQGPDQTEIAF